MNSPANYVLYPDLKDANVFITGGGSGIGAAFVDAFAAQGANVAFVCLSDAQALCDRVEQQRRLRPLAMQCDIRDIDALRQAMAKAEKTFGSIGILINNAARDTRHSLEGYSVEEWDDSLNTNLRPHYFSAQQAVPGMRYLGHGAIINVGSNSAILGLEGYTAYVTAKAGIAGLSKALARELGPDNIRVNTLIPGWVMTERQKKLWATPEAVEGCLSQQSLKRTIAEEDIANSALFLASNASAMITGQSLIVDGGRV